MQWIEPNKVRFKLCRRLENASFLCMWWLTFWKSWAAPPQSAAVELHPSAQWFLQTLFLVSFFMSVWKFTMQATRPFRVRWGSALCAFHSVYQCVCYSGNLLWGHQTWTSHALQPLVFFHRWEKLSSIVLLYLESDTRYRKSRKLEETFFLWSFTLHFRRLIKGLKICHKTIFKKICRFLSLLLLEL